MKNFDTRVYSVADFVEWEANKRSVWSEKAKSYLIDTMMRGKPIPKVLITQEVSVRRNIRIVVDGQRHLRAIVGLIKCDFWNLQNP